METDTIYISLGFNCGPRFYISKNLGLTKKRGYKTGPFDLCITPFDALCECIETDFEHFFEELKIIPWNDADGDRSKAGQGNSAITNKYKIIFNHEGASHSHLFETERNDDSFYTRNDFEELKIRYEKRIENFLSYIENYQNIVFIYKFYEFSEYNSEKLLKILNDKFKNKNINIKLV